MILIKFFNVILEIIYMPFKLLATEQKITFISRQSDVESADIKMLKECIKKELPGCKVVTLTKTIRPGIKASISYGFHMLKQMYHTATSRIVILDTYCIIISLLHHKKTTFVIQMWHALGLMKKAGYSILDQPEGRSNRLASAMKLHRNYQMILASSGNCIEAFSEVFGYPVDKICICPLPRVDLLRSEKYINCTKQSIYSCFPELVEKCTVVYAPTYRKEEEEMRIQIKRLLKEFPFEKYNLIINLHPLSEIKIDNEQVIWNAPFTTMELLTVADFVISDYSSIIFEAAIMKKPLLFFPFDLMKYQSDRDFFIDYKSEVPGPICMNTKELLEALSNYSYERDRIYLFAQKYVELSINNCTEQIVGKLKEIMEVCF